MKLSELLYQAGEHFLGAFWPVDKAGDSWWMWIDRKDIERVVQEFMKAQGLEDEPVECFQQGCSYFTQYLRYGPPDMSHAAYHAAERECGKWQEKALSYKDKPPPPHVEKMCRRLEREIRC